MAWQTYKITGEWVFKTKSETLTIRARTRDEAYNKAMNKTGPDGEEFEPYYDELA